MCGGIEAHDQDGFRRVYFPNPEAAIPLILADGTELGWVRWGRRKSEPGSHPYGGWAKLDTFELGGWERHFPQRALALVRGHMQKDCDLNSHWFDVIPGYAIECVVIGEVEERRVYVITTSPPEEFSWINDLWPKVVPINADYDSAPYDLPKNSQRGQLDGSE